MEVKNMDEVPKRKRGRPRKNPVVTTIGEAPVAA